MPPNQVFLEQFDKTLHLQMLSLLRRLVKATFSQEGMSSQELWHVCQEAREITIIANTVYGDPSVPKPQGEIRVKQDGTIMDIIKTVYGKQDGTIMEQNGLGWAEPVGEDT